MTIVVQELIDDALAAELAPLNLQITSLQSQLSVAQAALSAAQASLSASQAQVTSLTAQVASLNAQIADLEAQIAAFQPPIPTLWNTGYRGPITNQTIASAVTANDVLIENKNISSFSGFVVTGTGFILRNCILNYTGAYGVDAQNGPVTIENCSIRPVLGAGPSFRGTGLYRGNKIDITSAGQGGVVLTGVSTVRDNYFADVATGANYTAIGGNLSGSTISNNTVV